MSTTHELFDDEERRDFIDLLKEWPNSYWGQMRLGTVSAHL